jgi:sugar phosphate isomerase/epimerase
MEVTTVKLGFSTLGCPNYTVEQYISMARNNDYDGVEIRFTRGQVALENLEEFKPSGIKKTRQLFEASGIDVVSIDTGVRFTSPDPDERNRQFEAAKVYMGIASELNAPYIRVFGGPVPQTQDREETTRWIAEGLARTSREGASRGVTVLLETHDSFCTSRRISELFAYGCDENMVILWDVLHSYRHGESFADTYEKLGSRIKLIHFKDSYRYSATSFDFKLMGDGKIPFGDCVSYLKQVGYEGYVNFEWEKAWHPEIAEPEVAIPHFAAFMKPLLS